MTGLRRIFAVAFIGALALCEALWAQQPFEGESARVVRATRGDVLSVKWAGREETVMLYGVTCEELYTPTGEQAQHMAARLAIGSPVRVAVRFQQPKVRYVELQLADGRLLNHVLLLAGLARVDTVTAFANKEYAALEAMAREQEVGMWRPEDAEPPSVEPVAPDATPAERFAAIKQLEEDARFALALSHWRALPEAERAAVRSAAEVRESSAATERERALTDADLELVELEERLNELDREIGELESRIAESMQLEEEDVAAVYAEDTELTILETQRATAQTAYEIAEDQYGAGSGYALRYDREMAVAEEMVARRRAVLEADVAEIRANRSRERDADRDRLEQLTETRGVLSARFARGEQDYDSLHQSELVRADRLRKSARGLARLDEALEGSGPNVTARNVAHWSGVGAAVLPGFDIRNAVWALDYDSAENAGDRRLTFTAFEEDSGALAFREVADRSAHRSFEVFRGGGSYYLEVSADDDTAWEIEIVEYGGASE